jgi:hypothetical protein
MSPDIPQTLKLPKWDCIWACERYLTVPMAAILRAYLLSDGPLYAFSLFLPSIINQVSWISRRSRPLSHAAKSLVSVDPGIVHTPLCGALIIYCPPRIQGHTSESAFSTGIYLGLHPYSHRGVPWRSFRPPVPYQPVSVPGIKNPAYSWLE